MESQSKSLHFLIIDDDSVFLFLAKKTLEKVTGDTLIATFKNPTDALLHIEQNPPADPNTHTYILLDIHMPIMNGFEFLDKLKNILTAENLKNVTIIIVTVSLDENDLNKLRDHYLVKGLLAKPIDIEGIKKFL